MVKLSIIMPVFNASEYLEMSLNSIIAQTIDDYEVIIVDDGSTDNSKNVIDSFIKKHDNFKCISQENSGSGKARNNGIKNARGEYIAFLDADDKFLDDTALEKMYNIAKEDNADMVSANLKRITKLGTIEENYDYNNSLIGFFTSQGILKPWEYGIPWAFYKNIFKKSFIEKYGISFPNLLRGQDPVFLAKVLTNLKQFSIVGIDLYGYNHSASGGVNIKVNEYVKIKDYIQHFIDTCEILEKPHFYHIKELYKKEFIDYLNFRQNYKNQNVINVVKELFAGNELFKENDYGYLLIDLIKNESNKEDSEEYKLIKSCIFEESMIENTFIDVSRLQDFAKLSKNNVQDKELQKLSFLELKQKEEYIFNEKRKVFGKVGRYKRDIKYYIRVNDEILNSNSWKFTSYLRSLKHKF